MKRLNLFVCAALAIAGAASCDQVVPETEDNTLRISAAYTSDAAYGHGTQGWIESDKVGMFAYSDGAAVASNVLYTPSKVAALVESEYMPGYFLYDDNGAGEIELLSNTDIELPHGFNTVYLYTPYVEGLTDITAVPLPDLSAQEYVEGTSGPAEKYTFAYKQLPVCDCGIVRAGQMIPVYTQMTIVSPSFPAEFEGKKVTKVTVAAKSSYTKIAYKAATMDLTTGKVSGEQVNAIELLLPEGGLDIKSEYGSIGTSTLYVIMNTEVSANTTFVFTYTVDGQDCVMEAKPSEMMSSEGNLNMWGQLKYELPSEEETPAPEA